MNKVKGTPVKVNQWTLGLAAAGAIAFAAICSSLGKSDPPAQAAISESSQVVGVIVAKTTQNPADENFSPPETVLASQTDTAGLVIIADAIDSYASTGKEAAFTGAKLVSGVVSFVAGTHYIATVAHQHPRVLAIPVAAAAV